MVGVCQHLNSTQPKAANKLQAQKQNADGILNGILNAYGVLGTLLSHIVCVEGMHVPGDGRLSFISTTS